MPSQGFPRLSWCPLPTARAAGHEPEQLPWGTPITQPTGLQPLFTQSHHEGRRMAVTDCTDSLAWKLRPKGGFTKCTWHQWCDPTGTSSSGDTELVFPILPPANVAVHFSMTGTNCFSKSVLYTSREGFLMRNFAYYCDTVGKPIGLFLISTVKRLKNDYHKFSVAALK